MNNILIESGEPQFLSPQLPRPIGHIRRFSQGFNRFYYTVDESGVVTLYSSATTLIKDGYAEDTIALESWRNKLRAEGKNPETELNYAAMRGTIMHLLIGDYIQGVQINLSNFYDHISKNHPDFHLEYPAGEVLAKESEWLQKAILAFGQFVVDYNVKPLALELVMKSDNYGVASPLDLICEMDIDEEGPWGEPLKSGPNKGQPKMIKRKKTIKAIIDFKSSQNGFYDKHYFQLQLYKRIAEENYPNIQIEGLYNWSPKDWRTSPTYNLKEQSDGKLNDLCETVFEQGRIKHNWKTPTVTVYKDLISMDLFQSESYMETLPLKEYLEKFHQKEKEEKNGTGEGEKDTEQASQ